MTDHAGMKVRPVHMANLSRTSYSTQQWEEFSPDWTAGKIGNAAIFVFIFAKKNTFERLNLNKYKKN